MLNSNKQSLRPTVNARISKKALKVGRSLTVEGLTVERRDCIILNRIEIIHVVNNTCSKTSNLTF